MPSPSGNSASGGVFSQDFRLRERPELRVVFLIFSLEIIGSAMLIAVKAFFMIEELNMSPMQVGTVLSATMAAQLVFAPLIGRSSDACGRRVVMISAFFWVGFFQMATSLVRNYYELLIVRALIGMCGGTFAIATTPVLDLEPEKERRSMYMGLFGAITSLAFSIGPGLGALLFWSELFERRHLFLLAGCFAITSGIIAYFFLKETLPEDRRRPLCGPAKDEDGSESTVGLSDWGMVNLGLMLIWTANFLADFGKFFLYAMYAFLIRDLFGYRDLEFGIILMSVGLLTMLVQALLFPLVVRSIGLHPTTVLGALLTATGLSCLPLFKTHVLHFSMLGLFAIGSSFWEPGVPVLLGSYAPSTHLGAAIGVNFIFCRLGAIVSPVIGGWFYEICGSCSFFVGGIASALSGVLVLLAFFCATEVRASAAEKFEAKYADESAGNPRETEPLR